MPAAIDKATLLVALKEFLVAEIDRARSRLDIMDDAALRIRWSDCTDNLRALERVLDPDGAIVVVELEENEFYLDQLKSSTRLLELAVEVPYQLSGVMAIASREYRLAKRTAWHESLVPGAEFNGSARRDERWRNQTFVRAKA